MTLKELNNIKKYLSPTERKKIAKKFNVTSSYIRDILRNARHNDNIIESCINRALLLKSKKEKLTKKASQL